eukprot:TRINITY_DN3362_c0_g4_i1.p1 TRINITY_DN3362_c0_g4~~TRINITY_DN3362_c0_g4_i1.p1  ORF type:complete len:230 (+),score=27.98 TRINITY_DN3362_c0_g4_i1:60-749(+)
MGFVRAVSAQIVLFVPVLLIGVLISRADFGPRDNPAGKGLWVHLACAVLAFGYFFPNAVLAFRCTYLERITRKRLHVLNQTLALILGIVAVAGIFDYHNTFNYPNLYSVHSLLGLPFIILFAIQYVFSFYSYFWPMASESSRKGSIGYHRFFGVLLLNLAFAAMATGAMDLQRIMGFVDPYTTSHRINVAFGFFLLMSSCVVTAYLYPINHPPPPSATKEETESLVHQA